ncbi:MAG: Rrf2 family transcriptional regulator [Flavobacteriales bacterium]|nr:Rrf2 family transcriptional regulator [Flavobacteriales bacterium]
MFSKACEYGIKAIIYICHQSHHDQRVSLKQIATAIDSPVAFTAKILQSLSNHQIIVSVKGHNGGYEIPIKRHTDITLHQIVEAIDGDKIYNGCGLGLEQCNEQKPCPMHFKFKAVRDDLRQMLQTTTVAELTNGLQEGLAFLKR